MSERISSLRLSVQGPFFVSVTDLWVSEGIQIGLAAFQGDSVVFI